MASRELYESRIKMGQKEILIFSLLAPWDMPPQSHLGLRSTHQIELFFASMAMAPCSCTMGALTTMPKSGVTNLKHIVINNGAHDSVGGQPTAGSKSILEKLQKHVAIKKHGWQQLKEELIKQWKNHHHKRPRTP